MSEVLYIRLDNTADAEISWLIWSEGEKQIIASGLLDGIAQLNQLTDKAAYRDVVVIVPSQDVQLKALNVPGGNQRSMRQAAPYMLEEELAQDVEQLFFAYASMEKQGENNCFVAITKLSLMEQWLLWLKEANIVAKQMVPEVLALPLHQDAWSATHIGDQVILRQGLWAGMAVEGHFTEEAVSQWLDKDIQTIIHSYTSLPSEFDALPIEQELHELPLALMAQHISTAFNMLQGPFSVKSQRSPLIQQWLVAAGFCGVALLASVLYKGANLYQIKSERVALEHEIISAYKQAFPETKRVRISTIKSQLRRKVGNNSEQSGAGFLPMMLKLQNVYAKVPTLKTTSIKFDGKRKEIRLTASATSFQVFDQFKTELERAKFVVNQGAQNNQGSVVTGSISIKEGS